MRRGPHEDILSGDTINQHEGAFEKMNVIFSSSNLVFVMLGNQCCGSGSVSWNGKMDPVSGKKRIKIIRILNYF